MPLADICGQNRAVTLLRRAWTGGHLAQAYAFAGPAGVGKRTTALALAQVVNCLQPSGGESADACGVCAACRRIAQGQHPDVTLVTPEESKTVITIEQVRTLSGRAGLRAYEGKTKVWILDPAERMQEAAANAFLKTLEEPAGSVLFVLLTTAASALLPTVRSRCQEVRFDPLAEPALQAILARHGRAPHEAERAAGLAGGSAERALALDIEQEAADRERLAEEIGAALATLPGLLDTAERLGKSRRGLEEALDILETLTRDAALARCDDSLVPADRRALAARLLGQAPLGSVLDAAKAESEARRRLTLNAQPRFVCEHLLLELRAALTKGPQ